MHHRLKPKQHRFHYNVFMFYVDIDELPLLHKKLTWFSVEKFNLFSFKKKEHLQFPPHNPNTELSLRAQITAYLHSLGITITNEKIMLLTNMNVLGYNFNPVSFYYILNEVDEPLYAIAEVSNTYREMKPYFFDASTFENNQFQLNTTKYFYVSPFFDHDADFNFSLQVPGHKLHIKIDTVQQQQKVFISTLSGKRQPLTNKALLWYSLQFPLIPLRIMFLIHWNALLLWLKKIPYHPKAANPHLQQNVYRKYKSKQ